MFSQYKIIKYPIQMNKTMQMTNQTYVTHHKRSIQRTWFGVHLHSTPHHCKGNRGRKWGHGGGVGNVVC